MSPSPRDLTGEQRATIALGVDLDSPTVARRFASERLHAWRLAPMVETVELVVSELVRNAVEHARSESELSLWVQDGCLVIEVVDGSSDLPTMRDPEPFELTGRGLLLVDALSEGWDAHPRPEGKAVSCRIVLPDAASSNGA